MVEEKPYAEMQQDELETLIDQGNHEARTTLALRFLYTSDKFLVFTTHNKQRAIHLLLEGARQGDEDSMRILWEIDDFSKYGVTLTAKDLEGLDLEHEYLHHLKELVQE